MNCARDACRHWQAGRQKRLAPVKTATDQVGVSVLRRLQATALAVNREDNVHVACAQKNLVRNSVLM